MADLLQPRRALAHPLWIGSLALLILNDHFLKGAGLLPGWLTGKLSDFVGLLVAPAVLAAVLFVSTRRGAILAHAAVGIGFASIKIWPAAARAVEALTALTPVPWRITVDPTDLMALPMLAVSFLVLVPAMKARAAALSPGRFEPNPLAQRGLLLVGSVACMATSQVPGPGANCTDPSLCGTPATASLVLGNGTLETRLIRLRRLKKEVAADIDCDAVMTDPTHTLSRSLFGAAEAWLVEPNRSLLLSDPVCSIYLVDADGLDMTLLAWRTSDFPPEGLFTSVSNNPSRQVVLQLDNLVGRLELAPHPVVFEAPPLEDPAPAKGCDSPGEEAGINWSTPIPLGPQTLKDVTTAPDGCTALDLANGERFYLCVPNGILPFVAGDAVEFSKWSPDTSNDYPEAGTESATAEGLRLESAKHSMVVARGSVLAHGEGKGFQDMSVEVETEAVSGCFGSHDSCGSLIIPLEISLFGGAAPDITFLRAGEQVTLSGNEGTLHLVRAQDMPIRDPECTASPSGSRLFESIFVRAAQ